MIQNVAALIALWSAAQHRSMQPRPVHSFDENGELRCSSRITPSLIGGERKARVLIASSYAVGQFNSVSKKVHVELLS